MDFLGILIKSQVMKKTWGQRSHVSLCQATVLYGFPESSQKIFEVNIPSPILQM